MFKFDWINEKILSIDLSDISMVNREELNFINSNKELGFIYIELNQFNNLANLIYNVDNKIALRDLLKYGITIEQANSIIKDLILIKDISFSAINLNKIFLNLDNIYIDSNSESARLKFLYLPLAIDEKLENSFTIEMLVEEVIKALNNKEERERLLLILNGKSIKSVSAELIYLVNEKYSKALKDDGKAEDKSMNQEEVFFDIYEENKKHGNLFWKINYCVLVFEVILLLTLVILELYVGEKFVVAIIITSILMISHTIAVLLMVKFDKGKEKVVKKVYKNEKRLDTDILNNETMFLGELTSRLECYDGNELKRFNLEEYNLLGRNLECCNIVLESKSISKTHASIKKINEDFYLLDEGSSNGTYLNGKRLDSGQCLKVYNKDEILLGNVLCIFKGE